jgi:hypothetical protein
MNDDDNDYGKGYNGNYNLKKKGIAVDWDFQKIQEYLKCAKDPIYFAEKYIQIVHVDLGLIPIELYDYQKEIIEKVSNGRRTAVNTSRQAGKTTTAMVIILHFVLFNPDGHKTVALLANKGDAAREILDRIKIAYEALPKWMQQGVVEWNKGTVEFENGCKIIAAATSSSAIRGKSIAFLYIDETAFVENWDEFFASVFPTISSGETTKILFTSTPNGLNHFYKTCMGAKEKTNGYEYIEVPWYLVPGRDEEWKEETLGAMDWDYQKFSQEFECEFLGSSGTLISGSKLKQMVSKKPIKEQDKLSMYEMPIDKHSYVVVVDVARGKGLDYSAFQVIDVTEMPYKLVASYRDNNITPYDYSGIIFRTAKGYNKAMILVEVNDIGQQVADTLRDEFDYDNVLYTQNNGRAGKSISQGFGTSGSELGIRTTKSVKSLGCSVLKLLIEQDQLIINDYNTIQELSTFSKKGTSFEAEAGCHDDMVMCLVLFSWLSSQKYFSEFTDINTISKLRDFTDAELEAALLPFGFLEDGQDIPLVIDEVKDNWFGDFINR